MYLWFLLLGLSGIVLLIRFNSIISPQMRLGFKSAGSNYTSDFFRNRWYIWQNSICYCKRWFISFHKYTSIILRIFFLHYTSIPAIFQFSSPSGFPCSPYNCTIKILSGASGASSAGASTCTGAGTSSASAVMGSSPVSYIKPFFRS